MILLFDIGNTHTHVGLANNRRMLKQANISTRDWFGGKAAALAEKFGGKNKIKGAVCAALCRARRRLSKKQFLIFGN